MKTITGTTRKSIAITLFGLLCGGLSGWPPGLWRSWSKDISDQITLWAGPSNPPAEVVVIAVDDASLQQARWVQNDADPAKWSEGLNRWPWPRAIYGQLIERVMAAGSRGVAINVLFAGQSMHGPEDDARFAQALERHGSTVVLAAEMMEPVDRQGAGGLSLESPASTLLDALGGFSHLGLTNMLNAEDGSIGPHPEAYGQRVLEPHGFALQQSLPSALLKVAGLDPPHDQADRSLRLYGPEGSITRLSAWEILDPERWRNHPLRPRLRDSLVLIGPTLEDNQSGQSTPFGTLSGVELLATATANDLDGSGLRQWPQQPWQKALLSAACSWLIAYLATRRLTLRWRLVSCSVGLIGLLVVSILTLVQRQTVLPLLAPSAGVVGLASALSISTFWREEQERRRLRQTFERYVAPSVVQEILKDRDSAEGILKGRTLNVTVLFSDLEGFTALTRERSQQGRSEDLIDQLNRYLGRMVEVISEHGGTVDKFIGDCVMAVFGSPVSRGTELEARQAVRCAAAMREALAELNQVWRDIGLDPLSCGIGLASGKAVVGQIGSPQRMDFTVIGDTVNLASRLESLTRELQTPILMDERTARLAGTEIATDNLGEKPIKGMDPCQVFRPRLSL